MLTGLDDDESIDRAYEVGATDFISKPITWAVLGYRVRYLLRASHALRDVAKHQASLETAQRIAHLGSWEWNVQRNEVYWSPETFRILGLAPDAATPSMDRFLAQVHPQDRATAEQAISDLVRTGEFSGQLVRVVRPDGSVRHVQLQGLGAFDARGAVNQLAGTIQDVTELKEAEQRIRHLAYYDGATGLPNRQFFTERLAQALALAKRHRGQLGVLALDLDQFKRINDTLGHTAGNQLLAAVARRLADAVREADALGRPDGESPVPIGPATSSRAWTATNSAC
jgi:PAS domain S-box-containing protein